MSDTIFDITLVRTDTGATALQRVRMPEAVGPTLINPTSKSLGADRGRGSITTDQVGGTLWWVATKSSVAPSEQYIKDGLDANGEEAGTDYSKDFVATLEHVYPLFLEPNTTYYLHFVQEITPGVFSNVATSAGFTTDTLPVLTGQSATASGATALDWAVTTDKAEGTLDVEVRKVSDGSVAASTSVAVSAAGELTGSLSGLSGATDYEVGFVHRDKHDNASLEVTASVTTESLSASITHMGGWTGSSYGSERPISGELTTGLYLAVGAMEDNSNNEFIFLRAGDQDLDFFSDTYLSSVPGIAIYWGQVTDPTADSIEFDPINGSATVAIELFKLPDGSTLHDVLAGDHPGYGEIIADVQAGDTLLVPVITTSDVDPAATFSMPEGFSIVPGTDLLMETGNRVAVFIGPTEASTQTRNLTVDCSDGSSNVRLEPVIIRPPA